MVERVRVNLHIIGGSIRGPRLNGYDVFIYKGMLTTILFNRIDVGLSPSVSCPGGYLMESCIFHSPWSQVSYIYQDFLSDINIKQKYSDGAKHLGFLSSNNTKLTGMHCNKIIEMIFSFICSCIVFSTNASQGGFILPNQSFFRHTNSPAWKILLIFHDYFYSTVTDRCQQSKNQQYCCSGYQWGWFMLNDWLLEKPSRSSVVQAHCCL